MARHNEYLRYRLISFDKLSVSNNVFYFWDNGDIISSKATALLLVCLMLIMFNPKELL